MNESVTRVFSGTRTLSTVAAFTAASVSAGLGLAGVSGSAQWQVWPAVIALAIGIPHGAMDHLVTVPTMALSRMIVFITGYLAVVAVAIIAIAVWNVVGFILVVAMSAVHFGIGDAAFVRTLNRARGRQSRAPWWVYAIPAGALPVVVPLTTNQADQALAFVNPALQNWHQGVGPFALWLSLIAAGGAIVWLVAVRQYRDALDLVALASLSLTAPPLVAFAVYFGLWHAQRHTARLVPELPRATQVATQRSPISGFVAATVPGLPALVGTLVVAGILVAWTGGGFEADFLWVTLVIIWALTVPHMALTWRLDRQALNLGRVNNNAAV